MAGRDGVLLPGVDRNRYQATVFVSWVVSGYWAATLPFVWWTPWVQIPWFLTGMVGYAARQIMRRRSAAESAGPDRRSGSTDA